MVAKEQAKASAMRQRFEERKKRFLDAKQRTIGVDKETLQQQVEEKNFERIKQKEEGRNDGKMILLPSLLGSKVTEVNNVKLTRFFIFLAIQLEQLCNYLEERELAKQDVKRREVEDVQATLELQVRQPKNNAIAKGSPLDLDNCGPSSIQRFDGEDNGYNSRKKMQQQQVSNIVTLNKK